MSTKKDYINLKMAQYMEQHKDEEFDGIISGVTNFGIFVTINEVIEGLISYEDMPDFEKKLTCGEVGCCINFIRAVSVGGGEGKPKFITPPTIADFSAEDILYALNNCGLIHGFTEIIENELFLILTK